MDRAALRRAQEQTDVTGTEVTPRSAFFTDTRPLIGHVRRQTGREPDALAAYRASGHQAQTAEQRETKHGPPPDASYA